MTDKYSEIVNFADAVCKERDELLAKMSQAELMASGRESELRELKAEVERLEKERDDYRKTIILQGEEVKQLKSKLNKAVEALEFYAAYPGNRFSSEWDITHVCDSYSGRVPTFDWDGDLQEEPYDIARSTLKLIKGDGK